MTASTPNQNKVILFQGDSITDGNRGRSDDPNHILGHSYAYIIGGNWGMNMRKKDCAFITGE